MVGAAAPGRLRAVRAALAAATPPTDPDRRAWHRAAAVIGPDAQVATDLDGVAHRARSRSAYDVAATALERAGWLSVSATERVDRLVAAAECAWIAGRGERALTLLGHVGEKTATAVALRRQHCDRIREAT